MKHTSYKVVKALSLLSVVALSSACAAGDSGTSDNELGAAVGETDQSLIQASGPNATKEARTASGVALDIIKAYNDVFGWTVSDTVISAQYYTPNGSGGVDFVAPTGSGFPAVPNAARAALAFAQQSPTVAKYLLDGLNRCRSQTNGTNFMLVEGLDQAAQMHAGAGNGSTTGFCPGGKAYENVDPTQSYCFKETWTNQAWDGQKAVTVRRMYKDWSPNTPTQNGDRLGLLYQAESHGMTTGAYGYNLNNLNGNRSSYTGGSSLPCSPFEGPAGQNPYFIMAFDGQPKTFQDSSLYVGVDCRFKECVREIDVDPIAYLEPVDSNDPSTGQVIGSALSVPFALVETSLDAAAKHQGQWATGMLNGVSVKGRFSQARTMFGVTKYHFVAE